MPDLVEATKRYWQQLDELEAAYQRGEVSPEQVNTRVSALMAELGRERRAALRFLGDRLKDFWLTQKEAVVAVACLAVLTCAWMKTI